MDLPIMLLYHIKNSVGPGLHIKLDCTLGGLYLRTSFIFKYETFTHNPFVKPSDVLNLAVQLYDESAYMYNPGLINWREQLFPSTFEH